MLCLENLTITRGGLCLLDNINLTIKPGEVLCITGANGCGKSSLLRALGGLLPPQTGSIKWRDIIPPPACDIHFLPAGRCLLPEYTVIEALHITAQLLGTATTKLCIEQATIDWQLQGFIDKTVKHLSQGQKQRLLLATLSLQYRPLWLLDEPATALDHTSITMLVQRIKKHCAHQGITILATHQTLPLKADHYLTISRKADAL